MGKFGDFPIPSQTPESDYPESYGINTRATHKGMLREFDHISGLERTFGTNSDTPVHRTTRYVFL